MNNNCNRFNLKSCRLDKVVLIYFFLECFYMYVYVML